jgi:hypothetical protein
MTRRDDQPNVMAIAPESGKDFPLIPGAGTSRVARRAKSSSTFFPHHLSLTATRTGSGSVALLRSTSHDPILPRPRVNSR